MKKIWLFPFLISFAAVCFSAGSNKTVSQITFGSDGTILTSTASLASIPVSSFTASGITAGSYTNANVTFNAQGIATSASNGSAGGGGSGSPLEVFNNFNAARSSPTLSIGMSNAFGGSVSGSTFTFAMNFSSIASQSDIALQLTQSSATANYMTLSSSTANDLKLSSASATYLNKNSVYVSSINGNGAVNVTANGTSASVVNFSLNSSSVTMYGPTIPAAAISAGTLGASVLVSSLTAIVGAGSCMNCNATFNAQGQVTTFSNGSSSGGNGAVNSGTIGQNAYYAVAGTTVSGSSNMITNTSSETFNVTTNHLFGLSASTGNFTGLLSGTTIQFTSATITNMSVGGDDTIAPLIIRGQSSAGKGAIRMINDNTSDPADPNISMEVTNETGLNPSSQTVIMGANNGSGILFSPVNSRVGLCSSSTDYVRFTVDSTPKINMDFTQPDNVDIYFGNTPTRKIGYDNTAATFSVTLPTYFTSTINVSSFVYTSRGIVFPDSTIQITANSGSSNGSLMYPATGTPNMPLGYLASTGTITSTITVANLYFSTGSSIVQIATTSAVTVSACGLSPSIRGGNHVGEVTFGTGAGLTSCTVTFSSPSPFSNNPICFYSSKTGGTTGPTSYISSVSAVTFNGTSLASDVLDYQCFDVRSSQ